MPPSPTPTYLKQLNTTHNSGVSTEHSFRADLQQLIEELLPAVHITNEPRRIECGAPDYVLARDGIPLGYIEAKDLDKSLDDKAHHAQLKRYVEALDNLIFTNYLEFRFYRDGDMKPQATVAIAELRGGKIKPLPQNFTKFEDLIQTFGTYHGQTITAADDLAARMASKARLLADTIGKALGAENEVAESRTLDAQMRAFKKILIADITVEKFADVYAQTIAYGMFAARLHDPRPADFSRHKAAKLIPKSNPFLKKFFGYIADYELDERIRWIVDNLADIFRATEVEELMKDFGKATQRTDPFIHFYETFLGKYDKKERKSRGVYYTPEPVVAFIVRAVDDILKTEFRLADGLASAEKTTVTMEGKPTEIHKVQILDPATGTGTFLAEVVKQIYQQFAGQKGAWHGYVKENLTPRLNGFEVLMAPYAMAHLKLEMILREAGCELGGDRLRVFLTNSLEEHHPDTETLFAVWLSDESREANTIKRDVPVMVVLGNPPYAVSSSNRGEWIQELLENYKKNLNEKKLNLDDDYIKFIRYGEHLIERTGEGILAYISNNSFIDGITHRQMRRHLLETFDKIYILDLHGNSRKKECSPDGSPDKNVFDIMQGVSINLFVKTGKKKNGDLGEVFHCDLFGERERKHEFLWEHDLNKVGFTKLETPSPYFFFVPKDFAAQAEYEKGFATNVLFDEYTSGIQTKRDKLTVAIDVGAISRIKDDMENLEVEEIRTKYTLPADGRDWKIAWAKQDIKENKPKIVSMLYRPFDIRKTLYTGKTKGFLAYPRHKTMHHILVGDNMPNKENIGVILPRLCKGTAGFQHGLVSKHIIDIAAGDAFSGSGTYFFPLYLYPEEKQQSLNKQQTREPNLNPDIIKTIADKLTLRFTPEKTGDHNTFAPIDLLDYIYATLHSPAYRQKYREFLKIDFPRVPYPADQKQFRALAKLGAELRALHLMESPKLNTLITTYPQPGDNIVTAIQFAEGKVSINKTQHFTNVPQTAWTFQIGGYQPAQKYLKDRKNRALTSDEIKHYQKVIVALTETAGVMDEIDKI